MKGEAKESASRGYAQGDSYQGVMCNILLSCEGGCLHGGLLVQWREKMSEK